MTDVRYWHKADMTASHGNAAFEGIADIGQHGDDVAF
jgi:hypothetical protein